MRTKMQQTLQHILVLALGLFAATTAQADILFLNLNGATSEVSAARQAAAQLGEKLHVVPETASHDETTFTIAKALVALARQGVRPRALITSGHHVKDEGFFGTNGEVALYGIRHAYDNNDPIMKEFFGGIQSVYLWGCYTGTYVHVDLMLARMNQLDLDAAEYSPVFPNVQYVVGFADKAPLSSNPNSGKTLQEFLLNERTLRSVPISELQQNMSLVTAYKSFDFIIHRDGYYVTKETVSTRAALLNMCKTDENLHQSLSASIHNIINIYNGVLPVPDNMQTGALRQDYQNLQKYDFCVWSQALDLSNQFTDIPRQNMIIFLIHYKDVVTNFSRIYGGHLQWAANKLKAMGVADVDFITQMDKIDRQVLIGKLNKLKQDFAQTFKNNGDLNKTTGWYFALSIYGDINSVIYPDEMKLSYEWLEKNSTNGAKLPALNDLAGAWSRAQLHAREYIQKKYGTANPLAPQ